MFFTKHKQFLPSFYNCGDNPSFIDGTEYKKVCNITTGRWNEAKNSSTCELKTCPRLIVKVGDNYILGTEEYSIVNIDENRSYKVLKDPSLAKLADGNIVTAIEPSTPKKLYYTKSSGYSGKLSLKVGKNIKNYEGYEIKASCPVGYYCKGCLKDDNYQLKYTCDLDADGNAVWTAATGPDGGKQECVPYNCPITTLQNTINGITTTYNKNSIQKTTAVNSLKILVTSDTSLPADSSSNKEATPVTEEYRLQEKAYSVKNGVFMNKFNQIIHDVSEVRSSIILDNGSQGSTRSNITTGNGRIYSLGTVIELTTPSGFFEMAQKGKDPFMRCELPPTCIEGSTDYKLGIGTCEQSSDSGGKAKWVLVGEGTAGCSGSGRTHISGTTVLSKTNVKYYQNGGRTRHPYSCSSYGQTNRSGYSYITDTCSVSTSSGGSWYDDRSSACRNYYSCSGSGGGGTQWADNDNYIRFPTISFSNSPLAHGATKYITVCIGVDVANHDDSLTAKTYRFTCNDGSLSTYETSSWRPCKDCGKKCLKNAPNPSQFDIACTTEHITSDNKGRTQYSCQTTIYYPFSSRCYGGRDCS